MRAFRCRNASVPVSAQGLRRRAGLIRTELGARMRNTALREQSRSERTNTVIGQPHASIMDILAPHLHVESIGTA